MRAMFAHITPLEAPIVWLAFFAGAALGAFVTWRVMARRNLARD
jgi:Na+-driven multidrug efflux pump